METETPLPAEMETVCACGASRCTAGTGMTFGPSCSFTATTDPETERLAKQWAEVCIRWMEQPEGWMKEHLASVERAFRQPLHGRTGLEFHSPTACGGDWNGLMARFLEVRTENSWLRKALGFYANDRHYHDGTISMADSADDGPHSVNADEGAIARAALETPPHD